MFLILIYCWYSGCCNYKIVSSFLLGSLSDYLTHWKFLIRSSLHIVIWYSQAFHLKLPIWPLISSDSFFSWDCIVHPGKSSSFNLFPKWTQSNSVWDPHLIYENLAHHLPLNFGNCLFAKQSCLFPLTSGMSVLATDSCLHVSSVQSFMPVLHICKLVQPL